MCSMCQTMAAVVPQITMDLIYSRHYHLCVLNFKTGALRLSTTMLKRTAIFDIWREKSKFFITFLPFIYCVCALMCTQMFIFYSIHLEVWGQLPRFSSLLHHMCLGDWKLRTSGLVASGFAHRAILSTQKVNLFSNHTNSLYASWSSSNASQVSLFKWLTHKEKPYQSNHIQTLLCPERIHSVSMCAVLNWKSLQNYDHLWRTVVRTASY